MIVILINKTPKAAIVRESILEDTLPKVT